MKLTSEDLANLFNSKDVQEALAKEEAFAKEAGQEPSDIVSRLGFSSNVGSAARPVSAPPVAPPITADLVKAAILHNFDLASAGSVPVRDWLLARSSLISASGKKLLQLWNSERSRILDAPETDKILDDQLREFADSDAKIIKSASTIEKLTDAYLREILRGSRTTLNQRLSPLHQRALTAARHVLEGVARVPDTVPSVSECERQAGLSDLLHPLGILIGIDETQPPGSDDRFAGRSAELGQLRSFVDELDSQSTLETISRAADRLMAHATGRKPRLLTITAHGGLGKTALVAKFLHQHAWSESRRFPFAFLDFDRADLQPRSPGLLLVEICRQLALQYPQHSEELAELQESIRRTLTGRETGLLKNWCATIQNVVRAILSRSKAQSFLLAFDTFEIIDSDPDALRGVITLLESLTRRPFPELCVVASGRAGLDDLENAEELQFRTKSIQLGPLTVVDARAMVSKLGKQLLAAEWADEWVAKIVGSARDPARRREPLTLRLAVEIVRDADRSERPALVAEIHRLGEKAGEEFVGALYERRILDHIRDKNARKLAWPGLVARTVTRELASDVLAPVCELSPEEAGEAFDSLSKEGWIVDVEFDDSNRKKLRHRCDLRSRTLPLMRRHNPEKFAAVLDTLIAYYRQPSNFDELERAYYIFLRGKETEILSGEFSQETLAALARDRDDFERGSVGWCLLEARVSERLLDFEHMKCLPDDLLWDHVARTGSGLRGVNDRRIEPRVRLLLGRPRPSSSSPGSNQAMGAWQALQMKCGFWDRIDPDGLVMPTEQFDLTQLAFYVSRLSLSGRIEPDFWLQRYPVLNELIFASRGTDNWHALTHALLTALMYDQQLASHIDHRILEALSSSSGTGRLRECSLRILVRFGRASQAAAASAWCKLEAARIATGISVAEFVALANAVGSQNWPATGGSIDWLFNLAEDTGPEGIENAGSGNAAIVDDERTVSVATNMLEQIAAWDAEDIDARFARSYCSIRDPEWIVPFAYFLDGNLPADWRRMIEPSTLEYAHNSGGWIGRVTGLFRAARHPTDMIGFLSRADRAADFDGRLRQLKTILPSEAQERFASLMEVREKSRAGLLHMHGALSNLPPA